MTASVRPSRDALLLFKQDLWKDQRQLDIVDDHIVKCFESPFQASIEVGLLRHLEQRLRLARVPQVISCTEMSATYPYVKGIRLFNLFVELDNLPPSIQHLGRKIKEDLLNDANARQKEIQEALAEYQLGEPLQPYPASRKVEVIIRILADALGISVNWSAISRELSLVDDLWKCFAKVPFRDATPKNMVLAAEDLWLRNFDSEQERAEYIVSTIQSGSTSWKNCDVIDFDFSSCTELSTPEDDPISLNFHERTWRGDPLNYSGIRWQGVNSNDSPVRTAITFIVRYYRFGGRKAAYRLLHPSGHRTRFRHDSDVFYFQRLPSIVDRFWPDSRSSIPEILSFTELVARNLGGMRSPVDLFLEAGLGEKRTYYVDIYPE